MLKEPVAYFKWDFKKGLHYINISLKLCRIYTTNHLIIYNCTSIQKANPNVGSLLILHTSSLELVSLLF
jgi:hypothetical protein